MDNKKCYCGKDLEDGKVHCGNNVCMKKYLKTVDQDWYYPVVAFCCFFGTMFLILMIIQDIEMTQQQIELGAILLVPVSAITPIVTLILIHRYRQNKKGLPFWGN